MNDYDNEISFKICIVMLFWAGVITQGKIRRQVKMPTPRKYYLNCIQKCNNGANSLCWTNQHSVSFLSNVISSTLSFHKSILLHRKWKPYVPWPNLNTLTNYHKQVFSQF